MKSIAEMEEDFDLILAFVFIVSFLFLFAWLYSSYQENKKITTKQFLVSFLFAFISSQAISWAIKKTESFEEAIRILKEDKNIQSEIGHFNEYSYNKHEVPAKESNPANVKVTLTGSKGSVYVHCIMVKDNAGKWRLKELLEKQVK